jgi:hypothetical protein
MSTSRGELAYLNRFERNLATAGWLLLIVCAIPSVISSKPGVRTIGLVCVVGFASGAYRMWSRPSVYVKAREVVIRGGMTKVEVERGRCQWSVQTSHVGIFRRSVLTVSDQEGTIRDLGKHGVWARLGSKEESELTELATRLNNEAA